MNIFQSVRNNISSILTGIAITGAGWGAIEAVKATPKAIHILEENRIDARKEPSKAIKACWRCYIYPAGILAGTTASILGAVYFLDKDKEKVLAALAYSELKRRDHINFEKEFFGDEYEHEVKNVIDDAKRRAKDIPNEPLMDGMMWCYEPESDQWFQTNTEQILWAELTANKMFNNNDRLTFNQFLSLFPYAKHNIEGFDYYGWYKYDDYGCWDFNWSFFKGSPWIDIQPQINTKECYMVLKYGMHPGDDPDCNDLEEPEQFVVNDVNS